MTITVFIADDHALVRDGLRSIIENQPDMTVIGEAADGQAAIEGITATGPDVAILDLKMPVLDGIRATREICRTATETQVILLTMYALPAHVADALEAGALGYVLKESAGQEVMDAIRTVHRGERYLSAPIHELILNNFLNQRRSSGPPDLFATLSPRERDVFYQVIAGRTSKEIAGAIYLSPKTIDTYRHRIMSKLGVHDLTGLMRYAMEHDLLSE